MKRVIEFLKLFFKGAVLESSKDRLEYRAHMLNDDFLLVVFSDRFGIPNPLYYYLVELLPYIAGDISRWEVRMADRKSIVSRLLGEIGEP